MIEYLNAPFFGIFLTVIVFWIGQYLFKKHNFFIFQPLFVGMVLGILSILIISKIIDADVSQVYDSYKIGGDIVFWFLNPATIAFAIPLYKRKELVKKYFVQIVLSLTVGLIISLCLIYVVSVLVGLSDIAKIAMLPQAATTAIALPITKALAGGGSVGELAGSITAMAVILNAVVIYALGDKLAKLFKLENNPIGLGLSFGTAGHTLGAAKAIEFNATSGAMASISMVVIGVIVDIIVPIFGKIIGII